MCEKRTEVGSLVREKNVTHRNATGPQIALLVLAEQSFKTITMKIKMTNKFTRGDLQEEIYIIPNVPIDNVTLFIQDSERIKLSIHQKHEE